MTPRGSTSGGSDTEPEPCCRVERGRGRRSVDTRAPNTRGRQPGRAHSSAHPSSVRRRNVESVVDGPPAGRGRRLQVVGGLFVGASVVGGVVEHGRFPDRLAGSYGASASCVQPREPTRNEEGVWLGTSALVVGRVFVKAPHGIKIVGGGVKVESLLSAKVYFYTCLRCQHKTATSRRGFGHNCTGRVTY